jgi:uncharacterized heparinase superfamily protein
MAGVAADLAHPDGEVALFNDGGLAMAYSPRECLAAFWRLLGRPPKRRRIFALESAGYFGMREDDNYFIADCGPIAPDALVAHAHGDVLSFEWSVGGKRIVVDQGVFEYNAGARRQAARGAANHNTLSIEGADQAEFFGAFRCGRRPNVELLRHQESETGFVLEGAHNGYAKLPGKPQHARRFEVSRDAISILDLVEGRTESEASIGFLFHPKCRVDMIEGGAIITSGGVKIRLDCSAPLQREDAVWWPDMGVEIPTWRVRAVVAPGKNVVVRSRLSVLAQGPSE